MPTKAPGTANSTPKVRSLWRNRDYLLLWSGQTISDIGGGISQTAFPLLVLYITNSPLAAATAGTIRVLPNMLFFLLAGAWVDRYNRKHVMLLCDIGRACSLISIPITMVFHSLTIWQLYITAFIEGTLLVFFGVAQASGLSQVITQEQIPAAMAQQEVIEGTTILLGPAIAGPLFTAGPFFPFLADAISYIVSIITLSAIRTPFQAQRNRLPRHLLVEIKEGILWAWKQPVLRAVNSLNAIAALINPSSTLIVIVLARQQHASTSLISTIFVIGGLGAITGSLLAPLAQKFLKVGQTIMLVRWLFALLWPCYLLAGNPFILGIIEAGLSFVDPFEDVAYFSYRLAIIPDELRGRVISACRMFTSISNPLGQFLMGWLLEIYGPRPTVIIGWLVLTLVATLFCISPKVRRAKRPEPLA
ncbi:MFS transporter [Dictyobacter kobayashii]|uniref:MFS transporter n=1 Tax=Dictyobacter kobayashii TaxID=2014872 RepID=A0A402AX20_9CHLR|nr:MFS transporter [Dictyobacter kobayashii]GCE23671.1 MFS transporter [Dictyobacter kobayashii]